MSDRISLFACDNCCVTDCMWRLLAVIPVCCIRLAICNWTSQQTQSFTQSHKYLVTASAVMRSYTLVSRKTDTFENCVTTVTAYESRHGLRLCNMLTKSQSVVFVSLLQLHGMDFLLSYIISLTQNWPTNSSILYYLIVLIVTVSLATVQHSWTFCRAAPYKYHIDWLIDQIGTCKHLVCLDR